MVINTYPFDTKQIVRPFPDTIEDDEWVVFHGTSGFNTEQIESQGFDAMIGCIPPEDIRRVTNLFETMKWAGNSMGGYSVLKPFSLDYDFQTGNRSLLFFAESSIRALLYASRDYAGGEKLRALRYAFADLDDYLNDYQVRAEHLDYMKLEFNQLVDLNAHPDAIEDARPVEISVDWLAQELIDLKDIQEKAQSATARHHQGVVYAVCMTHDDLAFLNWHSTMGVEATQPILAERIVGKVIVPQEYEAEPISSFGFMLRSSNGGLWEALRAKKTS